MCRWKYRHEACDWEHTLLAPDEDECDCRDVIETIDQISCPLCFQPDTRSGSDFPGDLNEEAVENRRNFEQERNSELLQLGQWQRDARENRVRFRDLDPMITRGRSWGPLAPNGQNELNAQLISLNLETPDTQRAEGERRRCNIT
ncbi:hypothetical protein H072_11108 [Dactylellina haptotyla CBS 200.50]|uniref:Uncharacterized protein n=1 Tax=Dactylellina haptotyla (strain CBS 200.50) TaxID=1284197 RepID=S8B916_DACHA|nr:hypothetical protein H072_11108 [Dactylellina haptotyla CBS 200.50]